MGAQLLGQWSSTSIVCVHTFQSRSKQTETLPRASLATKACLSSPSPTIQIVGGKYPTWQGNGTANSSTAIDGRIAETDWVDIDADLHYWTRQLRPFQWYPGHIAKTEKELKEQLKLMDVVIEVRDARIPLSTSHPQVRAGVVGYPNVGKSSLINRLLKRRMCPAAPRPGVTRELKWVQFGKDLELLDSPGIIPMRISDQSAAVKLAICDDIGERSYNFVDVAAILVQLLTKLPAAGEKALHNRYKIDADGNCGKIFVHKLALHLFNGDDHQAAFRILSDFRKGKFGWVSLERPPKQHCC